MAGGGWVEKSSGGRKQGRFAAFGKSERKAVSRWSILCMCTFVFSVEPDVFRGLSLGGPEGYENVKVTAPPPPPPPASGLMRCFSRQDFKGMSDNMGRVKPFDTLETKHR